MKPDRELVYQALRDPTLLPSLSTVQWDRLLRRARRAGVLSRLAAAARDVVDDRDLPPKVRDHLVAARLVAAQHERAMRWEVDRIQHALAHLDQTIVLLKGAAYILAELPARVGRLSTDVDILVPRSRLVVVEAALVEAGWAPMKLDAYDQRFYRTWMHELPPMKHGHRGTVVDVHHAILPETSRYRPDSTRLLQATVRLGEGLEVLAACDMTLHAVTHLFADGDLAGGLREVIDIDALLRHFGRTDPAFWPRLVPRAVELDLERPLFYALHICRELLGTEVPPDVVDAARVGRPFWPGAAVMDALARRALLPETDGRLTTDAALWLLYVRSHWIRMPPWLLARHLAIKAWKRWRGRREI